MLVKTKSGSYNTPVFFPDATKAVIKGVTADDLYRCDVDGLVVNTYHLLNENLVELISKLGGIHKFMAFDRPVISDSGGFQVMSLVRENPKNGEITDTGIHFKPSKQTNEGHVFRELFLTPQNCIETQIKLDSDIIMCLDDCTNPKETLAQQELSVERTIRWAKECKEAFLKLTAGRDATQMPLLFCIVQGGNYKELRKKCAEELVKIGFDGYAFGGWPVENGVFLEDIVGFTASVMPNDKPKYAMGVGKPMDIIRSTALGFNMFDCVIPTRDARHRRLYVFDNDKNLDFHTLNISKSEFKEDATAISNVCECETCKNYSRAYLRHLFSLEDASSVRLSTIHNLRFYSDLVKRLRVLTQ